MLEGDVNTGVGEGSGFCFYFGKLKKNICIHRYMYIHCDTGEKEVVSRLFQSSSKQPPFLKYWENIQKSRDWYILLLLLKKVGDKTPPQPCLDW